MPGVSKSSSAQAQKCVLMKSKSINRRKFLTMALLAAPAALALEGRYVEPTRLTVRKLRLANARTGLRFAQFSDVHYKGDRVYLHSVVETLNSLAPDFCCFTGDLIEENQFLPETLEILSGIRSPVFGVPGNHDYWSRADFGTIRRCFQATGGAWLLDQQRVIASGKITLSGSGGIYTSTIPAPGTTGGLNILLLHYPAWVKRLGRLGKQPYDLILAGHSHGGQVQLPFFGAPFLPYNVDEYVRGSYQTNAGCLYVNPGIGYIAEYDFRFNCPPEITVFEV
jgi:predicted MPP superfamily phosphohydrolase